MPRCGDRGDDKLKDEKRKVEQARPSAVGACVELEGGVDLPRLEQPLPLRLKVADLSHLIVLA